MVTKAELDRVVVRGAGAERVRRVLTHADGRSANPFESVLRALCIEAGLQVVPQAPIELPTGTVHPDLVSSSATWSTGPTDRRKSLQRGCAPPSARERSEFVLSAGHVQVVRLTPAG